MTTPTNYSTLYNSVLTTSNATLYTSSTGDGIHALLAVNGTGSAATVSVTLVRKGGSPTDSYAVVIANALSIPANSTTELLNQRLGSEYGELLLHDGDYLYGEAGTGSAITLIAYGN
jgi:hypothetical protein